MAPPRRANAAGVALLYLVASQAAWHALWRGINATALGDLPSDWLLITTFWVGLPVLGAGLLAIRPWRRPSAAYLGLGGDRRLRDLALGLALGAAAIAASVGLSCLLGGAHLRFTGPSDWMLIELLPALEALVLSSAFEELAARGPLLWEAERAFGPGLAVALTSAAFGLGHAWNSGATPLALAGTAAAGALGARLALARRSLWLPIGLHIGWNVTEALVLGAPCSGIRFPPLLFQLEGDPAWTGDTFGPEATLPTLAVAGAGLVLLELALRRWPRLARQSLAAEAEQPSAGLT